MVNLNRNSKGKGFFQFCDFENFGKFSKKIKQFSQEKKSQCFPFWWEWGRRKQWFEVKNGNENVQLLQCICMDPRRKHTLFWVLI